MTSQQKGYRIRREIERLDLLAYELEHGTSRPETFERLIQVGEELQTLGEEFLSSPILPSETPPSTMAAL